MTAVDHPQVGVNGVIDPVKDGERRGWQYKPLPTGEPGPIHWHDRTSETRLRAFLDAARDWNADLRSQVAAK